MVCWATKAIAAVWCALWKIEVCVTDVKDSGRGCERFLGGGSRDL